MNDLLEVLKKLPEKCYAITGLGDSVLIKRGVPGYFIVSSPSYPLDVDKLNEELGVTKAQQKAMLTGAIFGWHSPGADPDRYDKDGRVKTP